MGPPLGVPVENPVLPERPLSNGTDARQVDEGVAKHWEGRSSGSIPNISVFQDAGQRPGL